MSTTSKRPRMVLLVAHQAAQAVLPSYGHPNSPRLYTLPQLLAIMVLKEFLRADYRKIVAILQDAPEWCGLIGLGRVPHFTTLQQASKRLLERVRFRELLGSTLRLARNKKKFSRRVAQAAMDSTGMEQRHTSHHFRKRKEETAKPKAKKEAQNRAKKAKEPKQHKSPFPKLGILVDCSTHLVLAARPGQGPCSDHPDFDPLLRDGREVARIAKLLADAGYDSEANHRNARQQPHPTVALIPATIGRPTAKEPSGYYRRRMKRHWPQLKRQYGPRWQVETVNSMVKRLMGSALRGLSYWSRCREMLLRVLTHNIMIVAATDQ